MKHCLLTLLLQETCFQYWPQSGLIQFVGYTVDLMEEKVTEGFTMRKISVYNEKVIEQEKLKYMDTGSFL